MKDYRISWDDYFMLFAVIAAQRSTCLRRQVGAVIVKDRMVLATGYNGQPRGVKHAAEVGCIREKLKVPSGERHELCRGLHAEQNAIIQAAYHGVRIAGADIYVTNKPCIICTKMIINAGIKRIIYYRDYAAEDITTKLADEMIEEVGLEVVKYEPSSERVEKIIKFIEETALDHDLIKRLLRETSQ